MSVTLDIAELNRTRDNVSISASSFLFIFALHLCARITGVNGLYPAAQTLQRSHTATPRHNRDLELQST